MGDSVIPKINITVAANAVGPRRVPFQSNAAVGVPFPPWSGGVSARGPVGFPSWTCLNTTTPKGCSRVYSSSQQALTVVMLDGISSNR